MGGGQLKFAFWRMNAGLMPTCVGCLLSAGLMQTWASVEHGYWFARSSEFLGTPLMQNIRPMGASPRSFTVFVGMLVLVWFVFTSRSPRRREEQPTGVPAPAAAGD